MPGDTRVPARHGPLLTHSCSSPSSCQKRTCFRIRALTVTSAWKALCPESYAAPCLPSFQSLCQSGHSIKNSSNCPYPSLPVPFPSFIPSCPYHPLPHGMFTCSLPVTHPTPLHGNVSSMTAVTRHTPITTVSPVPSKGPGTQSAHSKYLLNEETKCPQTPVQSLLPILRPEPLRSPIQLFPTDSFSTTLSAKTLIQQSSWVPTEPRAAHLPVGISFSSFLQCKMVLCRRCLNATAHQSQGEGAHDPEPRLPTSEFKSWLSHLQAT